MKLVGGMVAGSLLSALVVTALAGPRAVPEVWLGMFGPLAVASIEWIAVERRYRRSPEGLTALRLRIFAGKMIFFAAYVGVMLGANLVRPVPFIVSFTGYFLALLVAEAVALSRLTT